MKGFQEDNSLLQESTEDKNVAGKIYSVQTAFIGGQGHPGENHQDLSPVSDISPKQITELITLMGKHGKVLTTLLNTIIHQR